MGKGKVQMGPERRKMGGTVVYHIQSYFQGHICKHGSTWTCDSDLAGSGLGRSIAVAVTFPEQGVEPYLEETSSLLNSPTGCSANHAGAAVLAFP